MFYIIRIKNFDNLQILDPKKADQTICEQTIEMDQILEEQTYDNELHLASFLYNKIKKGYNKKLCSVCFGNALCSDTDIK